MALYRLVNHRRSPTSTAGRLWLGFGILTTALVVTVSGIGLGLRTLEKQLGTITTIAEPMSAAAYEMEISIIRTSMGVLNYLYTGEQRYRQQVAEYTSDFEHFKGDYDELAGRSKHQALSEDFGILFNDYRDLSEGLMVTKASQLELYAGLARSFEGVHAIINDRIRRHLDVSGPNGPLKLLGAANLATYTANIGTWLGNYTRTSDETYRDQVLKGDDAVQKELAWFKTLKLMRREKEWVAELEQRYGETRAQVQEAIRLHDVLRRDTAHFLELQARLDQFLKTEIRPLAKGDLVEAQEGALGVLRRILLGSLILLGAGVPIALGTSVTVGRGILRTEGRIAELLARERDRSTHLRQLADASLTINAANTAEAVLSIVQDEACKIIGARSCLIFNDSDGRPPPPGELQATFRGHGGRTLGSIRLTEKIDGEFTSDDQLLIEQLSSMVSVALENSHLYEELRQRDQRKDEFLATLGHELRNPLAPIGTALEILRLAKRDEATSEEARESIERQFRQLTRIVDDLLDVSRITRGRITLRKERLPLQEVVQTAIDASQPFIAGFGHELSVDLPSKPVWLRVDPTRLTQVIANLLNNAAKYTPERGHIQLSVEHEADEVVIRVRDTGIGIRADKLPQVFDLFSQVDTALERAQGGLGIGLFLVKRLIEMHGGTVEAISGGRGHGAEFVVHLPVLAESLEFEGAQPSRGEAGGLSGRRVLVADDNRDAAQNLSTLLQLWGHEVRVVFDGPCALEEALSFRPQMVLLDIGLPGMQGYEVAQRLREYPQLDGVVLVAVTGWGQEEDRRRAREAGFDHHLPKPVDLDALSALLAALT